MPLDPDVIVDRRLMKRRIGFWRIAAILSGVVAVIALLYAGGALKDVLGSTKPQISRISVSGFISTDRKLLDVFERAAKSDAVKGVIVEIDSAGGASVGGEAIYDAVRKLAAKKPTVSYIASIGASAGYMVALGADHVVARRTALTGSIGVIAQWPDVSRTLEMLGVKVEEVKSAPLKAEPNPFKPASPEAKAMLDRALQATFQYFVDLVADRRHMAEADVRALADGRVVTGSQARDLKLIDDVGEESVAVAWLEQEKKLPADLPIVDWRPHQEGYGLFSSETVSEAVARGFMTATGLDQDLQQWRALDGFQSIWHPMSNENTNNSVGLNK
ncbi:MAG: signal peptide peptidase SppA [Ancalomicrobiaceae bacterium]|nr:signal peptide peptidase SppA [Ancalomicrobiaceae bacterium]